jgi:6-phospho-beta-glucosidase
MRLAVLGGGGFRVPFVHQALLRRAGDVRVDELVLHDTDPDRLSAISQVLRQVSDGAPDQPALRTTTDLDEAVAGSDFVFTAIRVGGLAGRVQDERVALDLGLLGQETVGPGGIAFGLRTVPVMTRIAARIAELAPTAYVLNFTNPAGMITEAMQAVLGDRVLGICDTPLDLGRRLGRLLGVEGSRLHLDYVGLNHLGWMRGVHHDGVDLLPALLAGDRVAALTEAQVFGVPWLRALDSVPNEYLYYYYRTRDAVAAVEAAGRTRGEFLAAQQEAAFADMLADPARSAQRWGRAVAERHGTYMAEARSGPAPPHDMAAPERPPATFVEEQGYAAVALHVMAAIAENRSATMILDVRNGTTVAGLPQDAVIEVPCFVDATGVHPLATPAPDLHQLGLMQQVKAVERLTIRAATTGSRDEARLAFALHPLVPSLEVAERLVEGYITTIPEVGAVLRP